ncbi:hypothetical protein E2C01_028529 [Portunus trituberculatus]|uniref:Uncharacterized protein n=1 Tax=Portunus trituberculatus TaxID=210409 RepID=A0A5B7ENV7_PORTR|nr:hypothetical protein [Portunus trituberculatus]
MQEAFYCCCYCCRRAYIAAATQKGLCLSEGLRTGATKGEWQARKKPGGGRKGKLKVDRTVQAVMSKDVMKGGSKGKR